MRALRSLLALGAAAACALSGCSGGSGTPSTPIRLATSAPVPGGSSSSLSSTFAYDAAFVRAAERTGPAAFGRLGLDVVLRMRDAQDLVTFASAVSDPKSSSYRHFLTPDQIADRFGATVADQNAAIAYFHTFGIGASTWRQRMMIHISGTRAQLQAAFHTTFGDYTSALGEHFVAPDTAPSVPTNVPVVGSADIVFRTKRFVPQFVTSKGAGSGYSPEQIASAFDYTGAYNAGYTGSGITIGVVGTGPVVTSAGGKVGDSNAFRQLYKVAGTGNVVLVPTTGSDPVVNGASGFTTPPPVIVSGCNGTTNPVSQLPYSESPTATCNPEDGEAQLDTEQASALAPDATVQFYLAYNPDDGCTVGGSATAPPVQNSPCPAGAGYPEQGLAEYEEELQTIIDHDTADIVSGSFGGPEPESYGTNSPPAPFTSDGTGLDPTEFAMMTALGMSVFISSGDVGANGCQQGDPSSQLVDSVCVEFPASDPDVTGMGGVTAPINSAGQIAGPVTAWGVSTSGGFDSGSGGGVSSIFALPSYQNGAPGVIGTMRNVPDLALDGDPQTGVATLAYADPSFGGAQLFEVGGTSVAAPQMAAMWALVVQACKQDAACASKGTGSYPYRLGNANPMLYSIYESPAFTKTFLPITYGDNSQVAFCSDPDNQGATPCPVTTSTAYPLDPGYSANASGQYNQLTGIGVPFGRALIRAVVGV